ncbi:hypothetical protein [Elizabethkingia bruuniana]|uniref:hypothetical protein n=1 Tax=Elizabethkingia bruuniana TaxID=1756149 RepID=UPI00241E05EF|nr:hypothetical protein [Elizabethkingia bruuniana]
MNLHKVELMKKTNSMTKEELTHVILGKQLIHDFDSKDFVDWVITIIQQGNIKIKLIEKYR